ncbi:MAG: TrkH family potassium uptake protein [Acidobacteriota bacterium]
MRAIAYVLGQFLLGLAGTMLIPLAFGLAAGSGGTTPLAAGAAASAGAGAILMALFRRRPRELSRREGLLLVVVTWVGMALFAALPFYLSPHFGSFTDAFFESASGLTTTGATVLEDVEGLPAALQFWRCFTHWLGGMGIVLLGVAILPLVGHGGMHLYRAEFSGARSEKLKPRIAETAIALWRIYFALTAVEYVALRLAGMTPFEALCHTFSTLGTGGFSTRNGSIADFHSPVIEMIVLLFMLLAGVSFVQHYRLWVERRPRSFFRDVEIRYYFLLFAVAGAAVCSLLVWASGYSVLEGARRAFFQVGAILTTTGLVTDDFEIWHPLAQVILLTLMFVGGCTGSTAGGMKMSRILLLGRVVDREFKRMVERRAVFAVRLGGQVIPEATVQSLLSLIYLAFFVNFVSCILLAAVGIDVLTTISAVAASMFNVGPALGAVGPTDSYAQLPALAKWVLTGCMIAGRLEFYTLLILLTPSFWRR